MAFVSPQPADLAAPAVVETLQKRSLVVGAVLAVIALIGVFTSPQQFLRSYLLAFMLWLGITLGAMAVLMLQHLSGGRWGLVIRRVLEAASRNVPLMALFFLPILVGVRQLFPWANATMMQNNEALRNAVEHKALYLNWGGFAARAVFYFAGWSTLAYFLNRWSLMEDASDDRDVRRAIRGRFQALSGGGLVFYGLAITFASIDWIMSLDPAWSSTIYGIIILGGQGLSAMAFSIAIMSILCRHEPMEHIMKKELFQDLGTMMLAFVMLWTYFSFSQFLIIWSGNLAEEIPWYLRRLHGGWQAVALIILLFHFILPFLLLLSRDVKGRARSLAAVAVLVVAMRYLDLFWLIAPNFQDNRSHFAVSWLDFVLPVAMGGIWLASFFRFLRQRPLLPLHDPQVEQVLEPQHG